MIGLALGLGLFLVFGSIGWTDTATGDAILLFLLYTTLLLAGYFAGRFGREAAVRNGMWAALALVALNIVVTASDISFAGIVAGIVLGAVIGAAGGTLARFHLER